MRKRHGMSRRSSGKLFTRTSVKVHPKNVRPRPMRGGIRL